MTWMTGALTACTGTLLLALASAAQAGDGLSGQISRNTVLVNTDNFVRAETAAQFDRLVAGAGGVNLLAHFRQPTPIDVQPVIRMNRDTLYSFAVVDISEGATLTMPDTGPDTGDRYMSAMIVNEDEYINDVFYGGGTYDLTLDAFDTPYVLVAIRTLVNSSDPDDVAAANAIQDKITIQAASAVPYHHPNYDENTYDEIYALMLQLAEYVADSANTFGPKEDVDQTRHMLGSASGWGGLPEKDAYYLFATPNLPIGEYVINVDDVPVDAFWSVSMYNEDGYFEQNALEAYSINNISNEANADGSFTVNLGGCGDGRINCLPLTEGWNYIVRMYRPSQEIIDGDWEFPKAQKVQ